MQRQWDHREGRQQAGSRDSINNGGVAQVSSPPGWHDQGGRLLALQLSLVRPSAAGKPQTKTSSWSEAEAGAEPGAPGESSSLPST